MATRPRPKWYCQIRLTITRVDSGLSGRLSQRARASRRPVDRGAAGGGSILRRRGVEHDEEARLDRAPVAGRRGSVSAAQTGPTSVAVEHAAPAHRLQAIELRELPLRARPAGLVLALEYCRDLLVLERDLPIGQRADLALQRRSVRLGLAQDRLDLLGELGDRRRRAACRGRAVRSPPARGGPRPPLSPTPRSCAW